MRTQGLLVGVPRDVSDGIPRRASEVIGGFQKNKGIPDDTGPNTRFTEVHTPQT